MWHIIPADKCFISRIIKYKRAVGTGIINPHLKLLAGQRSACRVIRIAEIDNIGNLVRQFGDKTVGGRYRKVDYIAPTTVGFKITCTPPHHIRIHIHRVNRVCNRHAVATGKDIADIAGIALRPVAHKDFVG